MIRLGETASSLVNVAAYQLGWFACVVGGAYGWGTVGAAVAACLVVLHLRFVEDSVAECRLVAATVAIGIAADTLHAALGILEFTGHETGSLVPLWIVALWLQFGTILHFCLRWLSSRYLLASLLGLAGGPLAFLGGERLGAATFGEPRLLAIGLLGLSWGILLPILVRLADHFAGAGRYRL